MLKITGKQFASGDEDRIEFITAGTISTEGKTAYISYEETPISGMEGCTTNLTVSNGKVTMSRTGDSLDETVMEFEMVDRYIYDESRCIRECEDSLLCATARWTKLNIA